MVLLLEPPGPRNRPLTRDTFNLNIPIREVFTNYESADEQPSNRTTNDQPSENEYPPLTSEAWTGFTIRPRSHSTVECQFPYPGYPFYSEPAVLTFPNANDEREDDPWLAVSGLFGWDDDPFDDQLGAWDEYFRDDQLRAWDEFLLDGWDEEEQEWAEMRVEHPGAGTSRFQLDEVPNIEETGRSGHQQPDLMEADVEEDLHTVNITLEYAPRRPRPNNGEGFGTARSTTRPAAAAGGAQGQSASAVVFTDRDGQGIDEPIRGAGNQRIDRYVGGQGAAGGAEEAAADERERLINALVSSVVEEHDAVSTCPVYEYAVHG